MTARPSMEPVFGPLPGDTPTLERSENLGGICSVKGKHSAQRKSLSGACHRARLWGGFSPTIKGPSLSRGKSHKLCIKSRCPPSPKSPSASRGTRVLASRGRGPSPRPRNPRGCRAPRPTPCPPHTASQGLHPSRGRTGSVCCPSSCPAAPLFLPGLARGWASLRTAPAPPPHRAFPPPGASSADTQ